MLQLIRDHATGWIAWGIVILICIPFALWGIYDYISPNPTVSVATVNGTELTFGQYQQAYQRHRNRLRQLLGAQLDLAQLDEGLLRQQSLDSMIREELLTQAAQSDGFRIGDEQLARAIHAQEPFKVDDEFNVERYEIWLNQQGYSAGGFEYELRRSLISEQILSGVGGSAFVTNAERQQMSKLIGQTRTFYQLTIPLSRFADIEITDESVEQYFADNGSSLLTPEAVSIEYIELSRAAIAAGVEVSDDDLRALYEASKLNYAQPERREASHILLRVPEDADEATVAQILTGALALKDRLLVGEDFAKLAGEESEDPGSSQNGGTLGYFERGDMVPVFDSTAFELQIGEISDVVRSQFGFHIIKLTGIQEGRTKTFEESREEVAEELRRDQAEQLYYEQLDQLELLTFEASDTLTVAADELDLEIREVPAFTRQGSTSNLIAADPKVVEAAFSDDVLLSGNNSGAVPLPNNRVIVLRVAEHDPSRAQTLDEARDVIVERLRDERARARSLEIAMEAVDELAGGTSREVLSQELDTEWVTHGEIRRDEASINAAVVKKVFELARPVPGVENHAMVTTFSGDQVVIALSVVSEGDPEGLDARQRQALDNEIVGDYGRSAFDAFVQTLREQADIVINEASFER